METAGGIRWSLLSRDRPRKPPGAPLSCDLLQTAYSLAQGPLRPYSQDELLHFRLRSPQIDPSTGSLVLFCLPQKAL